MCGAPRRCMGRVRRVRDPAPVLCLRGAWGAPVGRLRGACGALVGRMWSACGAPVGRLWGACGALLFWCPSPYRIFGAPAAACSSLQ